MPRLHALDFDEYFLEQYPRLVRELDLILGDNALARDVAQDAFICQYVSWARVGRFDKPGAWVRKVALRMAFRTHKNLFRNEALDESHEQATRDTDVVRVMDVRNAVQQLSPGQRTAVVLHYYRDLPVSEVADSMGVKESTAKNHLHQARRRLAEILVAYGPEE